jgi:hypothetical protein
MSCYLILLTGGYTWASSGERGKKKKEKKKRKKKRGNAT